VNPLNSLFNAIYAAMQHAKSRDDMALQRLIVQIKEEIEKMEGTPCRSPSLEDERKSSSMPTGEAEALNQKLRNDLEQKEREIATLRALVQEKDDVLAASLRLKDQELEASKETLARMSEQCNIALVENEKLIASQTELEASVESCKVLQDQNIELRRICTGQEAAIEELQQLVNDLQDRKEIQEGISNDLKLIIQEKETLIEKLQVAVDESESSLHKSENSVNHLLERFQAQGSQLEAALIENEKLILSLQSKQEECNSVLQQLNQSKHEVLKIKSKVAPFEQNDPGSQYALEVMDKYQNALEQLERDKRLIEELENEQHKLKSSLKGSDERIAYISSEWKRALENERKLRSQGNVEAEERTAIFEGEIERLKKEGESCTCL